MKKYYKFLPLIIFVAMIFIPFIANWFISNTKMIDNRYLKTFPQFSLNFANEYESYYNDTFAFRAFFVRKANNLKKIFKINTNLSIHGKDGWMFFDSARSMNGNTIVDYKGISPFSQTELDTMVAGINKAAAYFKSRGITYLIVVPPNKENVYPEFMPDSLQKERVSDTSRTDAAIDYIRPKITVPIINLKPDMIANKHIFNHLIYYKKDTHWNEIGSYLGYNIILKSLGYPTQPLTPEMILPDGERKGDLEDTSKEPTYKIHYEPTTKIDKRVLLFGDSFSGNAIGYLSETFEKSFTKYLNIQYKKVTEKPFPEFATAVDNFKPDIVIDETIERMFDRYIQYNDWFKE